VPSSLADGTEVSHRIRLLPASERCDAEEGIFSEGSQAIYIVLRCKRMDFFNYRVFVSLLSQSVVILSKFPFINLFNQMLDLIAPEFFENGSDSIAVSQF
jgi:hypothetical protein